MKLLDPFAGYRLASGHAFFHVALFAASWMVPHFGRDEFTSSDAIISAFNVLRWGHFILFSLAAIEAYANSPSDIPDMEKKDEEELDAEATELEKYKIYHRDGSWKLFSRVCGTISVFVYQGAVFYAQKVLADELVECGTNANGIYGCQWYPVVGNRQVWLIIETCCFYLYVLAAVAYIVWRQMVGVCWKKATDKSDMSKALNDFIEYATLNLTWFSFNFVLCAMPPVIIFALDTPELEIKHRDSSFAPIMYTLWGMHCVHFAFQLRIYTVRDAKGQVHGESQLETGLNKDDHYKLQPKDAPKDSMPNLSINPDG